MKPYKKKFRRYDLDWIKSNCIVDDNDCWIWQKSLHNEGYGMFGIVLNGKTKVHTLHRYVYQIVNNTTLPKNVLVRHSCHNRPCCNPDHLSSGSYKDNWYDSESVHRATHRKIRDKKLKAHNATLSDRDVNMYRRLHAKGKLTFSQVKRACGLSSPSTSSFLIGKTYKRNLRFVDIIRERRGLEPIG